MVGGGACGLGGCLRGGWGAKSFSRGAKIPTWISVDTLHMSLPCFEGHK